MLSQQQLHVSYCSCGRRLANLSARPVDSTCACGLAYSLAPNPESVERATASFDLTPPGLTYMFCKCGYFASSSVTQEITCPLCNNVLLVRSKEDQGRFAWAELHSCTTPTPEWYEWWLTLVPSYNCACQDNWREITTQNPPPLGDLVAFRQWAIDMHNHVNEKLGKPQWAA